MADELTIDDRVALADLVALYADVVDTRTFQRLDEVFVPGAVLDTGRGERRGLEEITAAMQRLHHYEATSHLLGQQVLSGGPDTARGVTYCQAHHLLVEGDVRTDRVMHIRYLDDFARTPQGWRIRHRRLITAWTDDRPVR